MKIKEVNKTCGELKALFNGKVVSNEVIEDIKDEGEECYGVLVTEDDLTPLAFISIYEYYGYFEAFDNYIFYGHEEIVVFNKEAKRCISEQTR